MPARCYTHAIGPRRSPRGSRPFRCTGHMRCGRTTIGQRPRSGDSDKADRRSRGTRICVVWSVADKCASWYLVCWVVLNSMDVGKNCYESLCGLLLFDCCLLVPGRARSRRRRTAKKEVRSNFTGDAAATVGQGTVPLRLTGPPCGKSPAVSQGPTPRRSGLSGRCVH